MVVIRRELPRTRFASPAKCLSHRPYEDSPFRVLLDRRLPCSHRFLLACLGYATRRLFAGVAGIAFSTVTPMAQMKPSSSRPTAVTTCCLIFPFAIRRR